MNQVVTGRVYHFDFCRYVKSYLLHTKYFANMAKLLSVECKIPGLHFHFILCHDPIIISAALWQWLSGETMFHATFHVSLKDEFQQI